MSIEEINKKFTDIIPLLKPIIKGMSYKYRKKIETDVAISEAYLYIVEKQSLCHNEDIMQRIVINFIKQAIIWTTSELNKMESVNNNIENYITDQIDDTNIDNKIELELWYSDKLCILEMYKAQETNKAKLVIFDLYFNKGITKGIKLSKHLKINNDYACRYIRELKTDLREFEKKIKKK